jgi:hypothetical protein
VVAVSTPEADAEKLGGRGWVPQRFVSLLFDDIHLTMQDSHGSNCRHKNI